MKTLNERINEIRKLRDNVQIATSAYKIQSASVPFHARIYEMVEIIETLASENKKLREVLKGYACPKSCRACHEDFSCGKAARIALNPQEDL